MSDTQSTREEIKREKKELKRQKRREKNAKKWEKQRRLIFPVNKKGLHIMRVLNFLRFLIIPTFSILRPYKLYGHKKVGKGAYIYMGNHYSMWDIVYPAVTTKEGIHFLAKRSVLEAPVVGWFSRKAGVIGAKRDGSDARTLMECMKVLRNGEKISLFPEGTRNRISDEEFLPFQSGAALLAIKTKTPVIPFVVCSRPKKFKRTHVVFGEPVELTEYYDRKLSAEDYAEADEKLKNMLYDLRAEHRAMLAAKKAKKKKDKT